MKFLTVLQIGAFTLGAGQAWAAVDAPFKVLCAASLEKGESAAGDAEFAAKLRQAYENPPSLERQKELSKFKTKLEFGAMYDDHFALAEGDLPALGLKRKQLRSRLPSLDPNQLKFLDHFLMAYELVLLGQMDPQSPFAEFNGAPLIARMIYNIRVCLLKVDESKRPEVAADFLLSIAMNFDPRFRAVNKKFFQSELPNVETYWGPGGDSVRALISDLGRQLGY